MSVEYRGSQVSALPSSKLTCQPLKMQSASRGFFWVLKEVQGSLGFRVRARRKSLAGP